MKWILAVLLLCVPAFASSPCGTSPAPGTPHVCLTWVASTTTTVTGYNIYRSTTTGGENYSTPLNAAPVTTPFYNDISDATGTIYFYTVVAIGSGGALSVPSSEVSAQIPVPPNSPTTPAASID
jgi:fibronectin type 3 domain-containing protein